MGLELQIVELFVDQTVEEDFLAEQGQTAEQALEEHRFVEDEVLKVHEKYGRAVALFNFARCLRELALTTKGDIQAFDVVLSEAYFNIAGRLRRIRDACKFEPRLLEYEGISSEDLESVLADIEAFLGERKADPGHYSARQHKRLMAEFDSDSSPPLVCKELAAQAKFSPLPE